jgi:hypothetical protein
MKKIMKAQSGKKLPKAGKQTPADFDPESYDKKYPRTKSGGANYNGPKAGPREKTIGGMSKNGSKVKKADNGLGMKSVTAGYDNNKGITRADFVSIGKGEAKSGAKMKKAMMGMGMHKMPDGSMMENSMMKKGGSVKKKMQYGGKAASMTPPAMMKKGGAMKKCKYGCK